MEIGTLGWYLEAAQTIDVLYQQELLRVPLPDNQALANWLYHAREGGRDGEWIRAQLRASPEWEAVHRPPVDIGRWRGDFLGGGDFTQPAFMYGGMPPALRTHIRDAWTHKGYTHLPLAVHNDYLTFRQWWWDWWDQPEILRACCQEIRSAGIEPIVVLHPRVGWSIDEHLVRVHDLWPHIQAVTRMVTWGWEINDLGGEWGNGGHLLRYLDGLHATIGETPIGIHFTPERWSGWPSFDGSEPERSEYDWLRAAKRRGATTLLYQESPDKPEDEVIHRAFMVANPDIPTLGGIADRVVGEGMEFVLFEFAREVARHDRLAARAIQFPTCSGFC